ncbi:acyl-CoA N-acyltransferase [Auricularia subglabra TFB-10046 SS5]|nr:acyl-CoA N-acyltransferase [Auricularia subglabra TFB-10046 SS5]
MSSFSIRTATVEDVPAMARVGGEAFKKDRNTQLKVLTSGYNHEATMLELLPEWVARTDPWLNMVAVDDSTGEVLGWAIFGQTTRGEQKETVDHDAKERAAREAKNLGGLTGANMGRWVDILMPPGRRVMFVSSIAVSPAHHSRGVGGALVKRAAERADKDGVYTWVHASEAAYHLFSKHGFEVVGELDLDLDEFAASTPPPADLANDEGKWGHYVFRYMKRLPQAQ